MPRINLMTNICRSIKKEKTSVHDFENTGCQIIKQMALGSIM